MGTRSSNGFTRLIGLLAGNARGEIHALLYSRTELRLCLSDESAKGLPYLFGLHNPESFAPPIKARGGDVRLDARRQELSAAIEEFPAKRRDLGVSLSECIGRYQQPRGSFFASAPLQQHRADAPQNAGAIREPAGNVKGWSHGHGAGQIDPAVCRP